MNSHFTAVYDACVLYPAPLRDLLLHLAMTDTFRARWTDRIHEEWTRSLLAARADIKREQLERTRTLMNRNVRDSLVTDFEPFLEAVTLPDRDDRHVLAAAIKCGADVIVTFNLSDFPQSNLREYGIEAQHPDDFIINLFDLHPATVVKAAADHRGTLKKPPKNVDEYLDTLLRQGLTRTVDKLGEFQLSL